MKTTANKLNIAEDISGNKTIRFCQAHKNLFVRISKIVGLSHKKGITTITDTVSKPRYIRNITP